MQNKSENLCGALQKGENMKKCKFTLVLDMDGDDIELNIAFESENYEDAIKFVKDVIKRIDENKDVLKEMEEIEWESE